MREENPKELSWQKKRVWTEKDEQNRLYKFIYVTMYVYIYILKDKYIYMIYIYIHGFKQIPFGSTDSLKR